MKEMRKKYLDQPVYLYSYRYCVMTHDGKKRGDFHGLNFRGTRGGCDLINFGDCCFISVRIFSSRPPVPCAFPKGENESSLFEKRRRLCALSLHLARRARYSVRPSLARISHRLRGCFASLRRGFPRDGFARRRFSSKQTTLRDIARYLLTSLFLLGLFHPPLAGSRT